MGASVILFDWLFSKEATLKVVYKEAALALVAVITRTKNRPLLLRRAFRSVASQTMKDFQWVVVNDGGEAEDVEEVAREAERSGISVLVVHNTMSLGMEAASNIGISSSESVYVAIHDDDDSWSPDFLSETLSFLQGYQPDGAVRGVVSLTTRIDEIITDNGDIKEIRRSSYKADLKHIALEEIASLDHNPPPISFLFYRDVLNVIGHFDEVLPVLGDWDFYLRFLRKYDIVVLQRELANYHIRPLLGGGDYGNTIVASLSQHREWQTYIINKYLLEDIRAGVQGLGFFLYSNRRYNLLYFHIEIIRKLSNYFRFFGRLAHRLKIYILERFRLYSGH